MEKTTIDSKVIWVHIFALGIGFLFSIMAVITIAKNIDAILKTGRLWAAALPAFILWLAFAQNAYFKKRRGKDMNRGSSGNGGLGSSPAYREVEKNIESDKMFIYLMKDITKLSIALDMVCSDTGKSDKEYRDKALKSDAYIKAVKELQDRHDSYVKIARKYQTSLR